MFSFGLFKKKRTGVLLFGRLCWVLFYGVLDALRSVLTSSLPARFPRVNEMVVDSDWELSLSLQVVYGNPSGFHVD